MVSWTLKIEHIKKHSKCDVTDEFLKYREFDTIQNGRSLEKKDDKVLKTIKRSQRLSMLGKMEGKRNIGRRRISWLRNIFMSGISAAQ